MLGDLEASISCTKLHQCTKLSRYAPPVHKTPICHQCGVNSHVRPRGPQPQKDPPRKLVASKSGASRIFLWQLLLHFRPLNKYVWALGSDVTAQPTVMENRDKLLSEFSPMWMNIFCLGMFFNIFFLLRSILLIPSSWEF
jgi:hypothetical protein